MISNSRRGTSDSLLNLERGPTQSYTRVMDADRWRKVKQVLDAALAVEPENWTALLDTQCAGDSELREQVMSLLGHLDEART